MAKDDNIELEGTVTDILHGGQFKVVLDNDHVVTASLSGKLRTNYIRIIVGDKVTLRVSPYDISRGIITWRGDKTV